MTKRIAVLLIVLAALVFTVLFTSIFHARKMRPRVSRLGRAVFGQARGEWLCVETDHFVGFGKSGETLNQALRKAEYAWEKVGKALELPLSTLKAQFYMVTDEALWNSLRTKGNWRQDGLALQYGNEFVFLAAGTNAVLRDEIPHEIVHFRLGETYGDQLPLALEEGLAMYVGWEVNLAYHLLHGQFVTRSQQKIGSEHLWQLDELVALQQYPEGREAAAAFYRQAEIWVAVITELVGKEQLGEFVRAVSEREYTWNELLTETYDCTERDLARIERAVERSAYKTGN